MEKKVLVVEDDSFIRDAYSIKMKSLGWNIKIVTDGESAVPAIKEFKPKLIVLDLVLPKMSGVEVLRMIKNDDDIKDIPVVVASNLDQKEVFAQTKELGAVAFFIKSNIALDELLKQFEGYIK